MGNFVDELREYFENTPKEKILSDWKKSEEFDNVSSDFTMVNHICQHLTLFMETQGTKNNLLVGYCQKCGCIAMSKFENKMNEIDKKKILK